MNQPYFGTVYQNLFSLLDGIINFFSVGALMFLNIFWLSVNSCIIHSFYAKTISVSLLFNNSKEKTLFCNKLNGNLL